MASINPGFKANPIVKHCTDSDVRDKCFEVVASLWSIVQLFETETSV